MGARARLGVAVLLAGTVGAAPAAAQESVGAVRETGVVSGIPVEEPQEAPIDVLGTSLAVAAGAFSFDLSGTGTAPLVAVRVDHALHPRLRAEGGVVLARPEQQFGRTTTFLGPEVQLQWVPFRIGWGAGPWKVEPYLGVGGGWTWDLRPAGLDDRSEVSFSGAVGTRIPVGDGRRSGLEAELRVRYMGTGFNGSSGDFTLGWYWGV